MDIAVTQGLKSLKVGNPNKVGKVTSLEYIAKIYKAIE